MRIIEKSEKNLKETKKAVRSGNREGMDSAPYRIRKNKVDLLEKKGGETIRTGFHRTPTIRGLRVLTIEAGAERAIQGKAARSRERRKKSSFGKWAM